MEGAGQRRWRRGVEAYLVKFQGQDVGVGQMLLLWATAVIVIVLVCAAFFSTVYWIFG
jgi:hypothetical protein